MAMPETDPAFCPKLRLVEAFPIQLDGQDWICLTDRQNLAEQPVFLNQIMAHFVGLMDGTNSLRDMQADFFRATGEIIPLENIAGLVHELEQSHYLEGDGFLAYYRSLVRQFQSAPSRPARHAGLSYEGTAEALASQIGGFLADPEGPRNPSKPQSGLPLRGLVSPHIDLSRGGVTYAHAYETFSRCDHLIDTFIIFGTSHNPIRRRFALTLKHFETPMGIVATDADFVRTLVAKLNQDYLQDEFAHRGEHSIEFQTVWLKHVLGGKKSFRIVPILVGSFHDIAVEGRKAWDDPEIREMVIAIRATMAEIPGHYCVIAGADLAHVGRRFGDSSGPTEQSLLELENADRKFLKLVADGDAEGMFSSIIEEKDCRRVCGYPPIFMTLSCLEKPQGEILQYRQWADLESGAAVTYAAIALY